ncbi:MAG: glycosyltransferase family 2 protein [Planctomycetota bacterium]
MANGTRSDSTNHEIDVVVIIPALNEEKSISLVLDDLPTVSKIFVVDNGSTDTTPQVAREHGATVITEPMRGYGAACLAGISAAESWAQQNNCNPIIVFVDGDYSDHVDKLYEITAPIDKGTHDFVLGSRLLGEREKGAMPPQSVFGNHLACGLMQLFFGQKYTDLGPFRALRLDHLKQLKMIDKNFGWTIEMQIKAVKQNLRILEIPVSYRRRTGTSKISGTIIGSVKAGVKILYSIYRYRG